MIQRKKVSEAAASNDSSKALPPEARVISMSNSGVLNLGFSTSLDVPSGEAEVIQALNENNKRLLAADKVP